MKIQHLRRFACIAFILMPACRQNSLHTAVGYQNLHDVKGFIAKEQDINGIDSYGHTPLLLAAQNGNYAIAKYLMDNGADINAQNFEGWTALTSAVYYGRNRMPLLLLEHGADPSIANTFGYNALAYAQQFEPTDLIQPLRTHGAKPVD